MTDKNILFKEYNGYVLLAIILIILLIIIYFYKFAGEEQDETRRPLKNSTTIKNVSTIKSVMDRKPQKTSNRISNATTYFSVMDRIPQKTSTIMDRIPQKTSTRISNATTYFSDQYKESNWLSVEQINKSQNVNESDTETKHEKQYSNLKCIKSSSNKFSLVKSQNAGVKVRISKSGLMFGANVIIDMLAKNFKTITIPDNLGQTDVKSYGVTDIKIVSFTKPDANIVPVTGSGISVSLINCAMEFNFKWRYEFGKGWFSISDSGSGSVKTTSISLNTSLKIGRDSSGKPTASSTSCSCSIGEFKIHFDGGLISSVYNIFKCLIENKLKKQVQDEVCSQIAYVINQDGNSMLATLNTNIKIDSQIFLDYTLTEDPIFTSEYIETSHAGEFFSSTGIIYNQTTPAWNIIMVNNKMVQFALTEKLFNSAIYVFQQLGRINQNFSIDKNFYNVLFPDLKNETLELEIQLSEAPFVKITTSSFLIHAIANIKLIKASGDAIVNLRATLQLDCDFYFSDNRVKGRVNNIVPEILIVSGNVRGLTSQELTEVVNSLRHFVIPYLNGKGAVGFPMPSLENLVLAEASLGRADGYAKLASDFTIFESN